MSALVFKFLIHICVWSKIFQANGVPNLRYLTRLDNNQWRFGKRNDFLAKSRFFVWKPALKSNQMYSNIKTPAIPFNFNRYGIQTKPIMAPIHQSYMIAVPTKDNYPSYHTLKQIEEKRKSRNLHHITIINTILPKPYLPTTPTNSHQTPTFQNYRKTSKQFHHLNFHTAGQQNFDNFIMNSQQMHQPKPIQIVFPSSPLSVQPSKTTIDYIINDNAISSRNIEQDRNEISTPVSQCRRKTRNDSNNFASDVQYYYCNNRITDYKNPTQHQIISIPPATSSSTATPTATNTTFTITTSTTTVVPTMITTKASHNLFNTFTTEISIFLPTPNDPLEKVFTPTTLKNAVVNSENDAKFKHQRQKYKQKKYEHQRQSVSKSDDIKEQQVYTTVSPYENMKFHSFFTIEDAVTRSPEMQVFNDPYQAYRHARRQQSTHQRQLSNTKKFAATTATTSKPILKNFFDELDNDYYPEAYEHVKTQKINFQHQTKTTTQTPDILTSTGKPKLKSFFDDIVDDDYVIRDAQKYDYSSFNIPQKSFYHQSEFKNKHKEVEENDFTNINGTFLGVPKINKHNFGLFESISTYTSPVHTTYKPNSSFKEEFLTTHKMPILNLEPTTFNITLNALFDNREPIIGKQNNNASVLNEVYSTISIPIGAVTEKKSIRLLSKPVVNLKSLTTIKYPKQRRLHKSQTNLTSTTTKITPTIKKVPKYQRQYKSKKLKLFKHLYTTSTTTSTSTTITPITTTPEYHTKRMPVRTLPTTSTTEEASTKRNVYSRTFSTTPEVPKEIPFMQNWGLSTVATKRKQIKSRTSSISTAVDGTPRGKLSRRGSKRANTTKSEKNISEKVTIRVNNKNHRRVTTSSPTPAKPLITRNTSGINSNSTYTAIKTSTSMGTSSTTTTMKTIMRIANSKSHTKILNDKRTSTKAPSEVSNGRQSFDGKITLTSTSASIPPLPIEIYFQKSLSPKI